MSDSSPPAAARNRHDGVSEEELEWMLDEQGDELAAPNGLKKRLQHLLDEANITADLKKRCCSAQCLRDWPVARVLALRRASCAGGNDAERRAYLASLPSVRTYQELVHARIGYTRSTIECDGVDVCVSAFKRIYGISENYWSHLLELSTEPNPAQHEVHLLLQRRQPDRAVFQSLHSHKGEKHLNPKETSVYNFIVSFASNCTEARPKRDKTVQVLRGITRWHDLYVKYCAKMDELHEEKATESYFLRIRKENWKQLELDERHQLPACTVCAKLNDYLAANRPDADGLAVAKRMRDAHAVLAHQAWAAYGSIVALVKSQPDYLLISIDGSPSRPLPHFVSTNPVPQLDTKLVGVLAQGSEYEHRAVYMHFPQLWRDPKNEGRVPVGADIIFTVLMLEIRRRLEAHDLPRPQYLIIEMDNTVADNKNQFFAHAIAQLVGHLVFRGVALVFPLPGHGRNQLDGQFGVLKHVCDQRAIHSLAHMRELLSGSGFSVEELGSVIDVHRNRRPFEMPHVNKMFAWRFIHSAPGVLFQARQFVGVRLHDPSSGAARHPSSHAPPDPREDWARFDDAWKGEGDQSAALLMLKKENTDFPLSFFVRDTALVADVITKIVAEVRRTPRDVDWWNAFRAARSNSFQWPPSLPPTEKQPDAEAVLRTMNDLQLTFANIVDIYPQPIRWFYASDKVQATINKMSKTEQQRQGVECFATARPSSAASRRSTRGRSRKRVESDEESESYEMWSDHASDKEDEPGVTEDTSDSEADQGAEHDLAEQEESSEDEPSSAKQTALKRQRNV